MSCSFALYWIFFLLINRIIKPMRVHVAMTAVIGMALCAFNKPTKAAAKDPNPICIAPMSADALPASLVNGAIDKAAEFGKLKPWQLRNKKIKSMVLNNPNTPNKVADTRTMPINVCVINTVFMICSLLYFFSITLFSWLLPISPMAMMANIQPYCCSVTPYKFMNTNGEPER